MTAPAAASPYRVVHRRLTTNRPVSDSDVNPPSGFGMVRRGHGRLPVAQPAAHPLVDALPGPGRADTAIWRGSGITRPSASTVPGERAEHAPPRERAGSRLEDGGLPPAIPSR